MAIGPLDGGPPVCTSQTASSLGTGACETVGCDWASAGLANQTVLLTVEAGRTAIRAKHGGDERSQSATRALHGGALVSQNAIQASRGGRKSFGAPSK